LKKFVACILIATFASSCVPASLLAESVFDVSRAQPLTLRLEPVADARSCGASGFMASTATLSKSEPDAGISPLKAGASSLLLPGLGEQRLGATIRAKVFFGLEAIGWISVASFLWRGYSRENSYKDYAVAFAGVEGTGRSGDYYRTIGEYLTNEGPGGYNEAMRREARDLYYPDVEAMDAYYASHAIVGDDGWLWRTEGSYRRYGALRDGSRFFYRVALYSAVGIAALRIVSAADAVRLARNDQRSPEDEGTTSMGLERIPQGVALFVQRSF
jgi:hypothetical protein